MQLIKVFPKSEAFTVIGTGTIEACEHEIDLLTRENESKGIWMIDEMTIGFKTKRMFATKDKGHVFDLIICEKQEAPVYYVEY